jgi:hypothetical protein
MCHFNARFCGACARVNVTNFSDLVSWVHPPISQACTRSIHEFNGQVAHLQSAPQDPLQFLEKKIRSSQFPRIHRVLRTKRQVGPCRGRLEQAAKEEQPKQHAMMDHQRREQGIAKLPLASMVLSKSRHSCWTEWWQGI